MWTVWLLLAGALATPETTSAPPLPWPSLGGSGLLTLQDTATLPPGHFVAALTIDNKDRDPLGLDIVDGAVAWTLGATRWCELYGQHVFTHGVSVPDTPVLPPPPLDVLVPPGTAVPRRPYYSLYTPIPYVDDSGPENLKADIPGEGMLGVKARLVSPRGRRPGLALSFELKYPLSQSLRDLQSGSGNGAIDTRLRATLEWRVGGWSAVYSTAFTRVGQPPLPDRFFESQGGALRVTDQPLLLPNRLDLGAGFRRGLGSRLALVGEITTMLDVGRRTPSLDPAFPIDFLGGVQFRSGPLRMTAALRYHGHDLPSMQIRPAPLAGLVDLTKASNADVAAYMNAVGLGAVAGQLRTGVHRLLVPPPGGPPLPPGSRVIPATYRIRSEGQTGFVLLWGLTF
jgi:hypothetical protein